MPEPSNPTVPDAPADEPTLVYGWLEGGDLVFAPLDEVESYCELRCGDFPMTWGEFRERFGEAAHAQFTQLIIEAADYKTLEDFLPVYRPDDWDGMSAEDAYASLEQGEDGRPPMDDDIAMFPGYDEWVDEPASINWWPQQLMLEWLPKEIQRQYGHIELSVHDGEFLRLDWKRVKEIVAALEALGYTCSEDSRALNVAAGYR